MNEKSGNAEHTLASIRVLANTSKWKKSRKLICRGGGYFERLKEILKPESPESLVFSIDGEKQTPEKTLLKHFYAILDLAKIEDSESRNLVPYSLRHYMITDRILARVPYEMVAQMVGNSAKEIENTYFHLNDKMRITSALAYYKIAEDGTVYVPTIEHGDCGLYSLSSFALALLCLCHCRLCLSYSEVSEFVVQAFFFVVDLLFLSFKSARPNYFPYFHDLPPAVFIWNLAANERSPVD